MQHETTDKKSLKPKGSRLFSFVFAILCIFCVSTATVTVSPRIAHAQTCETPIELAAHGALMQALQEAAMTALQNVITGLVNSLITSAMSAFGVDAGWGELDDVDLSVRTGWSDLWSEMLPAMKDMTKQLNVADLDKSRMWSEFLNIPQQMRQHRSMQQREIQLVEEMKPSEEICVADTINPVALRAKIASSAVKQAVEREFYETGLGSGAMGMRGTVSEMGSDAVVNAEFQEYMTNYYDPNFNSGRMPAGAPSPRARNQYNVAMTLFGSETLDLTDEEKRQDLKMTQRLLMGRPSLPSIEQAAFNSSQGRQEVLSRRQYQARINTYAGGIGDVIGERASAGAAPDVEAMQLANGRIVGEMATDGRVSYQEVKRTRLEEFWTPRYIKELNDAPHTAVQKQVDIYMMQTAELQDMMRKLERTGLIFSGRLGQNLDVRGFASWVRE